jgi:hypothetical protein
VLVPHQIEPITSSKADARKIGLRPIAIESGIAMRFPIPMNSVGYVIRSVARGSSS